MHIAAVLMLALAIGALLGDLSPPVTWLLLSIAALLVAAILSPA